jgi:hypothetical protein
MKMDDGERTTLAIQSANWQAAYFSTMSEFMDSIISAKSNVAGFESGKIIPCLTINFQFPGSTPSGKLVIIEYYPHDPFPLLAKEVITMLGLLEPVIVSPGEVRGVFKDFQKSGVILAPIPVQENHANA